jgi:hypothetical protein
MRTTKETIGDGTSPYCRRCCIEHDKNLHGSKSIPKSYYKAICIMEMDVLPLIVI